MVGGKMGCRGGRGPQLKVYLRVCGPMGPTRGQQARACYSLLQDYSAIIELVETLQALPTCDVAEQHSVCFHYTFALNRWVAEQGSGRSMWGHRSLLCKVIAVCNHCCSGNLLTKVTLMSNGPYCSVLAAQSGVGWWRCPWSGHSYPRSLLLRVTAARNHFHLGSLPLERSELTRVTAILGS